MTTPNPHDAHELLGAYALDALDDDERAAVEQLLETDPAARREVDELREAAALLAVSQAGSEPAPASLWARIESELGLTARTDDADADDDSQQSNVVPMRSPRAGRTWSYRAIGIAAAIALVVGLGAGFALHRNRTSSSLDAAYASAKRDGHELPLAPPKGSTEPVAHVAWNDSTGSGFVRNDGLAALPAGKVYQLWVIPKGSTTPLSLGVLGANPTGISPFHWTGPMTAFAVSVERAPGASTPSQVVATTA
jgi:anti-sigma-K factor RskA